VRDISITPDEREARLLVLHRRAENGDPLAAVILREIEGLLFPERETPLTSKWLEPDLSTEELTSTLLLEAELEQQRKEQT
jgi:hypothetical protein